MKICWDILEKLRYNNITGYWYTASSGGNTYEYKEYCKYCGEPFLTLTYKKGIFCSKECYSTNRGMRQKIWSKKEERYLKNNASKVSIYNLMKTLNRSKPSIKCKANKLRISLQFLQRDKYNVDYSFFETMTPQLAHFIGFWFADGNIYKNSLSFSVNIRDKEFLDNLVTQFSDAPVRIYKGRPNEYRFSIQHKKLALLLKNKYNFIPNKSLICEFPKYITDEYMKYFLQGYFEGDGWVTKRDGDVGFVTGSKLFCKVLIKKLITFNPKIRPDKKYYIITFNVKDSLKFLNYIYTQNKTIKMKRKYDMYIDIKEKRYNSEKYVTLWTFSHIIGKHNQYLYDWMNENYISPDIIDKNGYKYYDIDKLYKWSYNYV